MRRRVRAARRRPGSKENSNVIRLFVFSLLVLLAVVFKTMTGVGATQVFGEISAVLTGENTYQEAVYTLGNAISEGFTSKAAYVFGKKPVSGDSSTKEPSTAQKSGNSLPQADNVPKEVEESSFNGRVITDPAFAPEEKSYVAATMGLDLIENTLEYQDDTLDEPFEMPSPDIVDDTHYTLPFMFRSPLSTAITSDFGYRVHPISGETTFHYGVDLRGDTGRKITSLADGVVVEKGVGTIFGNYVKVEHKDGFLSFYAHMSSVSVKKGQSVAIGDKIGEVGSTGWSTGPHLHFEVRKNGKVLDPTPYV